MINNILKNKFLVTAIAISLLVFIVVLLLSPKKNSNKSLPLPSTSSALSDIVPINLSEEKRSTIIAYTSSIESKLPLYLESFTTTPGITTSISISRNTDDPKELVHLSIVGLSYINKNELDETKNQNVTAFKESFLKAIEMLEGQNIDPKRLLFAYSDVPYVRETASYWVDTLGLLK